MGPGLIGLVPIDTETAHICGSPVDTETAHIYGNPINIGTIPAHGSMPTGIQITQKSDGPVMPPWML